MSGSTMLLFISLCLCTVLLVSCTQLDRRVLDENEAQQFGAYCNDYSRPHFYISQKTNVKDRPWIIFLEGGGLCQNVAQCYGRYFDNSSHMLMSSDSSSLDGDASWPDSVTGFGLLESSVEFHKAQSAFSRSMLLPYCSSDLWQGRDLSEVSSTRHEEMRNAIPIILQKKKELEEKRELEKKKETDRPTEEEQLFELLHNQSFGNFTFRGSQIFKAIVNLSVEEEDLCNASSVLLAGSSAGGVGALALSPWLKRFLKEACDRDVPVAVLGDSQWFINFDNVLGELAGQVPWLPQEKDLNETNFCSASLVSGYRCCMSSHCLLQQPELSTVPVFATFSAFDGYIPSLFAMTLSGDQEDGAGGGPICKIDKDKGKKKTSLTKITSFIRFLTEYGGAMNYSLDSEVRYGNLSYFVPSCLQHVYLATSSLWDPTTGILGSRMAKTNDSIHGLEFNQNINSTVWDLVKLPAFGVLPGCADNRSYVTLRCAITTWFRSVVLEKKYTASAALRFRERCKGVQCITPRENISVLDNTTCPESIIIKNPASDIWSENGTMIVFCCIAGGLCLISIFYKVVMMLHLARINQEQEHFLKYQWPMEQTESQIPYLRERERVSISCLDTKYSAHISPGALKIWKRKAEEQARVQEEAVSEAVTKARQLGSEVPNRTESNTNLLRATSVSPSMINMSKTTEGCIGSGTYETEILHGISTYFNPGNLIAIMGPSGSGKTTFLDLLTGRRRNDQNGSIGGDIFINCRPFDDLAESYTRNTGYVLQLAIPFFEELTVRQNLTFAAFMRLPSRLSNEERFKRVEQVIMETGMIAVADTVVGGLVGAGLSGGQKRRLCVALQMLELPKVLILDEPTSGLDATSSMELLKLLAMLAESQRLVIVTIHQPRLEIFHMFDIILLLCQGELAYYGAPQSAPELFANAICTSLSGEDLAKKMDQNPADFIIDVLSNERYRNTIMNHYQKTTEVANMKNAIEIGRDMARDHTSDVGIMPPEPRAGGLSRVYVYEGRSSIRNTFGKRIYLPLIYLVYALALGSAYYQVEDKLLQMSTFCIWSFAPSIFMFPAVHGHLAKMLDIFRLEKQDGIGNSWEVVLQTFLRLTATSCVPIPFAMAILYYMTVPEEYQKFIICVQLTAFSLVMNIVWTAFAEFIICINPDLGFKVAPIITSVTGFVGGFLIPIPDIQCWYEWLFYINPNYYGYSGMMFVYLKDLDSDNTHCQFNSWVECYPNSGKYFLTKFGFLDVRPYRNFLILLGMSVGFLVMAILVLEIRFNRLKQRLLDILPKSKGKSKKSASGSQTSEPKPTIGLQNEHVASTVSNGNSSPGANDTNAHPYTTAYDKRLSYCTSPSESVNSVSIDMENPSPLPQLPRRIPPKERQLRRRETRSKLMGSTHYEVYNPYTACSIRTNISEASSGSSQLERLQGVLKKSEDRRAQMLHRMDTRVSVMLQGGNSTSNSPFTTRRFGSKRSRKEERNERSHQMRERQLYAAKRKLEVGDESDGRNVRFRLSNSIRRLSINRSTSGESSKKGGILKHKKTDSGDDNDGLRLSKLAPNGSFDSTNTGSPSSRRRGSSASSAFKRLLSGGGTDDGGKSDDSSHSHPSLTPSYIIRHSPLSTVSLQTSVDGNNRTPSPTASDAVLSRPPSMLSRQEAPAQQASLDSCTSQPRLQGNFQPEKTAAPVICLRRSSNSAAQIVLGADPKNAMTQIDEGEHGSLGISNCPDDQEVQVQKQKKQSRAHPSIAAISSASEYLNLDVAIARKHVEEMYTASEAEDQDSGPERKSPEETGQPRKEEDGEKMLCRTPPKPRQSTGQEFAHGPTPPKAFQHLVREKETTWRMSTESVGEGPSEGSDSPSTTLPAVTAIQPARKRVIMNPPSRQESNGSSLLFSTSTSSSRTTTANSSRSSSYSSRSDPFKRVNGLEANSLPPVYSPCFVKISEDCSGRSDRLMDGVLCVESAL